MIDVHLSVADLLGGQTISGAMPSRGSILSRTATEKLVAMGNQSGMEIGQERGSSPKAKKYIGARFAQCRPTVFLLKELEELPLLKPCPETATGEESPRIRRRREIKDWGSLEICHFPAESILLSARR